MSNIFASYSQLIKVLRENFDVEIPVGGNKITIVSDATGTFITVHEVPIHKK